MENATTNEFQAIRRGRAWLGDRKVDIDTAPTVSKLVPRLDLHVSEIGTAISQQEGLRVGLLERTADVKRAREDLWQYHMKPIVTVARSVAQQQPKLAADVRLPNRSRSYERVLASADAFVKAVTPQKQLFIDNGLADDFIEQLVAATDAFRSLIDVRGSLLAQRAGMTAGIKSGVRAAKKTVRLIDNAMQVAFRNSDLLREWLIASRIRATPVTPEQQDTAATATETPAATPPVATTPAAAAPAQDHAA